MNDADELYYDAGRKPLYVPGGDGLISVTQQPTQITISLSAPGEMIVMDSKSGRKVAHLPTADGMDGVYFDAGRKRVYISGGRGLHIGFAYVHQEKDADHYEISGKMPTRAGTTFWSPELNRYYVVALKNDKQEAAILGYPPED